MHHNRMKMAYADCHILQVKALDTKYQVEKQRQECWEVDCKLSRIPHFKTQVLFLQHRHTHDIILPQSVKDK